MPNPSGVTSFNDKAARTLIEAVKRGCYRETAASLAGISRRTFLRWLEHGREDSEKETPYEDSIYRQFFEDVEQAEAFFEDKMISLVATAAKEPRNWAAAMTILERKAPERYGRRDTTVLEAGDKPLVNIQVIMDQETRELLNGALERLANPQKELLELA